MKPQNGDSVLISKTGKNPSWRLLLVHNAPQFLTNTSWVDAYPGLKRGNKQFQQKQVGFYVS